MRRLLPLAMFLCACPGTPPASKPQPPATAPASAPASAPVGVIEDLDEPPPPPPTPAEEFSKRCAEAIASATSLRDEFTDSTAERSVAGVLEPYNKLLTVIGNMGSEASLFAEVHPDATVREAAEKCVQLVSEFSTDLSLSRPVYDAIAAVPAKDLDADTARFIERTLRDFKRAGVDRDEATRAKLKEIAKRIVELGLTFDRNIREDVRKIKIDPKQLAGLPENYIAAHKPGADGKVEISTDSPDYVPFRKFADDAAARKELYVTYNSRAFPQNDEVLKGLLAARQEQAKILGFADWADYTTADKMAKTGKNVAEFIAKVDKVAQKRSKNDVKALLAMKKKLGEKKAKEIAEWEFVYLQEKVRADKYKVDAKEVSKYFEVQATRDGLLAVTSRLFGVEYKKSDAPVWHPDVTAYDVLLGGKVVGRIYLDLYPREGKYKHAAQFTLRSGVKDVQLPEGVLVCNFPDPAKVTPALMDHDQVVTMSHEFGHLMHHIIGGEQRWIYFSGVATEWDFVEVPSQLMEEWAWDAATLASFAKHVDTKEPIPAKLVEKMRAADEFGEGAGSRRQLFLAATSLRFHQDDPAKLDFGKALGELYKQYSPFGPTDGTHLEANFGHLNGYSATYYTYMWSLVIVKDMFSTFKKAGMFDATTAAKLRALLAAGGTKDAEVLVKDFLGRPYSFDAFKKWLEGK